MIWPVTSLVAAVFAAMLVVLSLAVTWRRVQVRSTHGDAGDSLLGKRIRAHGNFTEYAPMALVLLALLEAQAAPVLLVQVLAVVFVLSRGVHVIGMLYYRNPLVRAAAMVAQHAGFIVAGAWLLREFLNRF
jgi:uncharacterized protein